MLEITRERFGEQEAKQPGRRCFAQHSGVQKNKALPSFSVKFYESVGPVYEAMTGNRLQYSYQYDNFWHFLRTEPEVTSVEEWEQTQGSRIFLRDCLSCSIALSINRDNPEAERRTKIGQLETGAKHNHDEASISALTEIFCDALDSLPFYKDAPLIAAVPARPGKTTPDLPTELARRIALKRELTDLTPHFQYGGQKGQVKEMPQAQRWPAWEAAGLTLSAEGGQLITGQSVVLIDDKYQSGVSVNFVAMILQQHGASEVYGLYAVKTLRDADND